MDEKHNYAKEYLEAMVAYAMGGRAAEKMIFNEYTTGASNDIERATLLARKMVCEYGMSEKLGPIAYGNKSEEVFLGKEIHEHKNFSETTQVLIDEEMKKIVQSGMSRAEKILSDNIDILHKLSSYLLEREILDSEEIEAIMRGEDLSPIEKENVEDEKSKESTKKKRKSRKKPAVSPKDVALAN
jgi:cell division protease FtsH